MAVGGAVIAFLLWRSDVHALAKAIGDASPGLILGALAFMFPSLHEGFGLPPLEAMACGTPVVSSRATSLAEVVGDAALPIDPLDVDSIAAGIDRVAEDGSLRSELRALGLAQAACFSWDDTARSTWSVLQAALENAR